MKKINRLVEHYVKKYDTNDPYKIAEYLNINIMITPLGNIAGIYKYIEHSKWIFINSELESKEFERVVMAHELGHAVLHWKENCCFMAHNTLLLTSKIERQANVFAANLLITEELLKTYKDYTIEQFSKVTGIDKELINIRLRAKQQ